VNKFGFALAIGGSWFIGKTSLCATEPIGEVYSSVDSAWSIGGIFWVLSALLPAVIVALMWAISRAKNKKIATNPNSAVGQERQSEYLLGMLLNHIPSAIWIKDADDDYRYILANDFYLTSTGVKGGFRFEGKTDFEIHPHDLAQKYRSDDVKVIESGTKQEFFEEYEDTDGVRHSIHSIKLPLPDYRQGRRLLLGMGINISEVVEKRNRLQEVNQLLQAIQDNLPCPFFVKDADNDFRYLMGNRTYTDFLSVSPEALIGMVDSELYPDPENVRACHESDLSAMETGYSDANEKVVIDGQAHILRCIKSRLVREDGRRLLVGICVDITAETELQEQLHNAMDELKIHAEQEHLLNSCLESALLNEKEDSAIQIVLAMVGERLKADHAYCFHYDYQENTVLPCKEWTPADRRGEFDSMPQFAIDPKDELFKLLCERQMLSLPDVTSPQAREIRDRWIELLPTKNVCSLFAIGIWRNGELWGHIGLSYCNPKSELSQQENDLLQSCAHIVEVILERQKNRDELERSEYEKLLLMDSIRIPIMLFNPDLQLIRCNNAALEIAGIPEEQVYRQPCWTTFCGNACRHQGCPVHLVGQDHKMHLVELPIKGRDYQLSAYPIEVDGKLINIMTTMVDVTELNATQRKLTIALKEAQNASKAKSYFLATMSHELRTPLNAVIGFSELLENGQLPKQEHDDYLRSINLAGNSLLSLINDVLDLSKLEAEQMMLVPQSTDLTKILNEIQAIFQYKIRQKQLKMLLQIDKDFPLLKLDSLRLRQILLNLIGNAVKFTEHGQIDISAEFRSIAPDRGNLKIVIRDTGIGIAKEKQAKIFEPFAQGDTPRDSHAYQGTGLGLAISHRLANRMGGRILLESDAGKGSCFTLELDSVEISVLPVIAEHKEELTNLPKPRTRVLLVDDVPMNLKVLQAMLRKLDIDSVCANSGSNALEILNSDHDFQMVLTDLWMPNMSGSELAQKIHEIPENANLPIAVITADSQMPEEKSAIFQGVLLKPVTLEALQNLLAFVAKKSTV
jgi:PAS domain S-box-containing protein